MNYTPTAPVFDWFIVGTRAPRVQAFFDPAPGSRYSDSFVSSNLTVPEGSFLLLLCAAFYNVTWRPEMGGQHSSPDVCRDMVTDASPAWASTECLTFDSVKLTDAGLYSCYQDPSSDPTLLTSVSLMVTPRGSTGRSRIIKQSLSPAYAVPPQRVVFTVEYEIGPTCNGTCEGIWTFVNGPDTVFDGRYDNVSGTINASSPTAAYAYVETEWLTPNRRLSRLVIPTVCDKNTGIFTFAIPDSTTSPASFDLRVEFPRAREVSPEEVGKGSDDTALRGRFLKNRVYEISCSTPGFLGAANLTSRLEFVYAKPPMYCLKNATVERLDYPVDGFLQELNGKRSLSRKCISPGVLSPDGKPTYFSRFTVRADRSARVFCILSWTTIAENGTQQNHVNVSQLQIKVVDRPEFLGGSNDNLLMEREGSPSPFQVAGDPMTIRCMAPRCQCDKLILEKDSRKVEAGDVDGIIRNDFDSDDVRVTFENSSTQVSVSLTFLKPTQQDGGPYTCRSYDHENLNFSPLIVNVTVLQPYPPIILANHTDKVYLSPDTTVPLQCKAQAIPDPEILWFFNGKPLTPAEGTMEPGNTSVNAKQFGQYECRAKNRMGEITRTFRVVDGKEEQRHDATVIAVATVCGVVLLITVAGVLWQIRRWRMASLQKVHTLMLKPPQQTLPLESFMPVNDQIESLPYDERYEVDKSKFNMCEVLGNGEYGKVYKGILKAQSGDQYIAVKVPRDGLNIDHHKALISELKIMIYVRHHVNVLRVIGACTKDIQNAGFYIITEYCDRGSLREYLLRNRDKQCTTCGTSGLARDASGRRSPYSKNIQFVKGIDDPKADLKHCYVNVQESHHCSYFTVETLLSYAYQATCGMEYLAAKNVVHRDLALRNLLLHGDVVKIADFGLSRHHYRAAYKSRRYDCPLPVFWMALESILSYKYSEKSDVWSFGIVLWELFSLGDSPYSGHRPDHDFIKWLREGNRMEAPKLASMEAYKLMLSCWNKDPDTRPTFSECKRRLGQYLDEICGEAYRALLLILASAKAASDELQLGTSTPTDSTESGSARYAMFGGSESAKSSDNSDSSGLNMTIQTSCDSISSCSDSEKPRLTPNGRPCEPNLYQAPICD